MSQLGALRRAAAGLAPGRVIDALDASFAAWRAPGSPLRARLLRELPRYSREVLDLALERGLRDWTGERLAALRKSERVHEARPPGLCAVWLAASVPSASFTALALPLLAGAAVYAKPSRDDPVSPALFAESLRAADAGVAAALGLGSDELALQEADAVIAHGRDATLAELRARVPAGRVFIGYGHKLSIAAVGRDAPLEDAARRAALDAAIYDGRGCLSPAFVLAEDEPRGRARDFAAALAAALERASLELPRAKPGAAEELAVRELRARIAMGEGSRAWLSPGSTDWGVLLAPEGIRPAPGLLRNLPVIPVRGLEGLATWSRGLAPHLSSIGHAGWGARAPALAGIAAAAGAARVCPLGELQFPGPEWRHDGLDPLRPLLRYVDVDTAEETSA